MDGLVLNIEKLLENFGSHWKCFCNFEGENKSIFIYRSDDTGMIRIYVDDKDNYGFISDLFVKEVSRQNGIGNDLLSIAEKVIGALELPFSQLRVKKGTWMEEWYNKYGFTPLYEEDGYVWMIKKVQK